MKIFCGCGGGSIYLEKENKMFRIEILDKSAHPCFIYKYTLSAFFETKR